MGAALNDRPKRLLLGRTSRQLVVSGLALMEPAHRSLERLRRNTFVRVTLYYVIESHCDVRPQPPLNLNRLFRSHRELPAVNVRLEFNAPVRYLSEFR